MGKIPNIIRVTLYVNQDLYRKLKAKLALQGSTISEWFRQQVQKFLDED